MQVQLEELDSIAFGANVLKIDDIDEDIVFSMFEQEYLKQYSPVYVYTKIPIEKLNKIHYMEQNGFEFVECQLKLFKRLTERYLTEVYLNNLLIEKVSNSVDLDKVKQISDEIFNDVDRISIDNKLSKNIGISRYRLYLENSFKQPNQLIYKITDKNTNEIIAFNSFLFKDDKSAMHLIGGIIPKYQGQGITQGIDYITYNNFYDHGRKNITTHISARNKKIFTYLINGLGFKMKETFVVLRKIY